MTASSIPRFNHVAMSLPADALSESGRSDLLAFYGEVFGWTEMPTMTVDRERLVLRCHSHEIVFVGRINRYGNFARRIVLAERYLYDPLLLGNASSTLAISHQAGYNQNRSPWSRSVHRGSPEKY